MSIYIIENSNQGYWDKNISSIFKDIVSMYVFQFFSIENSNLSISIN